MLDDLGLALRQPDVGQAVLVRDDGVIDPEQGEQQGVEEARAFVSAFNVRFLA